MKNEREEAVFGGLGLCVGITLSLFLPASQTGAALLGVIAAVAGMALVALTGFQFEPPIPRRLNNIQQYARVYRL